MVSITLVDPYNPIAARCGDIFTYNPISILITLVSFRCEFSFITYTLNIPLIPLIPLWATQTILILEI